jgi:hypothetical protein
MFKRCLVAIVVMSALSLTAFAQSDIKITKKLQMSIPGMESMAASMPEATKNSLAETMNRTSTIYIKGSSMRTDSEYKEMGMTGFKKRTLTSIQQCDKGRTISFNDKKKKYHIESGTKPNTKTKRGGYVTISFTTTDTGERMKLFGFESRHLKKTLVITPGENACQKTPMRMDIDGWYADVPTFSCPLKADVTSIQAEKNCYDEVVYDLKGSPVAGIPLKEIKTFSVDGQTMKIAEEVVSLIRTDLDASLFEAPAGYMPADSKAELGGDDPGSTSTGVPQPQPTPPAEVAAANTSAPSLAPPSAGMVELNYKGPKKSGVIRIGIAQPTIDMGNDFQSQVQDPATAVRNTLAVALKTGTVETVYLETGLTEQEAKQNECDYIFYSTVKRKKGGGGMFGMMGPMLAGAAASMIPGVGGMIGSVAASTVMTATTMSGGFKSKDEVTFEYRVAGVDGSIVVPPTSSKQKAKKDGEDVLTPQIRAATDAALARITKPGI